MTLSMRVGHVIPPTQLIWHTRHTATYIYHVKSRLNTPVWGSLRSPNKLSFENKKLLWLRLVFALLPSFLLLPQYAVLKSLQAEQKFQNLLWSCLFPWQKSPNNSNGFQLEHYYSNMNKYHFCKSRYSERAGPCLCNSLLKRNVAFVHKDWTFYL